MAGRFCDLEDDLNYFGFNTNEKRPRLVRFDEDRKKEPVQTKTIYKLEIDLKECIKIVYKSRHKKVNYTYIIKNNEKNNYFFEKYGNKLAAFAIIIKGDVKLYNADGK